MLANKVGEERPDAVTTREPKRVLDVLARLVGGEWIHESEMNGRPFRSRNVFRFGPDRRSVVSDGWLGGGEGMFAHSHAVARLEPATGEVRLLDVNQSGAIAHATIALEAEHHLAYDWRAVQPDGSVQRYDIDLVFTGEDTYEMTLARIGDDGQRRTMLEGARFRRVDEAR